MFIKNKIMDRMQVHKKRTRNNRITNSADTRNYKSEGFRTMLTSPMKSPMPELSDSGTSVIYMKDKKKFTDMARYIKKLGDERVSCKVDITIDAIQLQGQLRGSQGPYALQLVRGPLKSETRQFSFDPSLNQQEVALGHSFTRTTTLYRT